jgi:hypothetical protein
VDVFLRSSCVADRNDSIADRGSSAAGENVSAVGGDFSAAVGNVSVAGGDVSAAVGTVSVAGGDVSAASGDVSAASGDVSAAGGNVSAASGDVSAVGGNVSVAAHPPPHQEILYWLGVPDTFTLPDSTICTVACRYVIPRLSCSSDRLGPSRFLALKTFYSLFMAMCWNKKYPKVDILSQLQKRDSLTSYLIWFQGL